MENPFDLDEEMQRLQEMQEPFTDVPPAVPGSGGSPLGGEVKPAQFEPFGAPHAADRSRNIDLLLDVSLRVSVELGRTTMTIRDILALGQGSVVELDKLAGEPVDILVNDTLIARGEVVVVDEKFGVRVTEIVSPSKRVASLGPQ